MGQSQSSDYRSPNSLSRRGHRRTGSLNEHQLLNNAGNSSDYTAANRYSSIHGNNTISTLPRYSTTNVDNLSHSSSSDHYRGESSANNNSSQSTSQQQRPFNYSRRQNSNHRPVDSPGLATFDTNRLQVDSNIEATDRTANLATTREPGRSPRGSFSRFAARKLLGRGNRPRDSGSTSNGSSASGRGCASSGSMSEGQDEPSLTTGVSVVATDDFNFCDDDVDNAEADPDVEVDIQEDEEEAMIDLYYKSQFELQRQHQQLQDTQRLQHQRRQQPPINASERQQGGLIITDMADRRFAERSHPISSYSEDNPPQQHSMFVNNRSSNIQYSQSNASQHTLHNCSEHTSATVIAGNVGHKQDIAAGTPPGSFVDNLHDVSYPNFYRNNNCGSSDNVSEDFEQPAPDFFPVVSRNYEWMGRSIETLILGHLARAPLLQLDDDLMYGGIDMLEVSSDIDFFRRRSTASTFGSRRQSTAPGGRRSSLSLSGNMQGGTLANYYHTGVRQRRGTQLAEIDRSYSIGSGNNNMPRRSSTAHGRIMGRRRSSIASSVMPGDYSDTNRSRLLNNNAGPNVVLKLMMRESTGKSCFSRGIPEVMRLRHMGGASLFNLLDKPAAGMVSEVAFLAAAIDGGDWAETYAIISRLVVRLIGDPSNGISPDNPRSVIDDPHLPPTAPRFYAGGGRLGLERDAFVMAGGIQILIRIFREKSFVGQEMAYTYDARDLSQELVATRLAPCWNQALATLRELIYFVPSLVEDGTILDDGDFLPFLFTLLSHDSCFDGAVALIEEILSFMVQTHQQPVAYEGDEGIADGFGGQSSLPGRVTPASMFFLGNVPDLYTLWGGFNCRQLAHFCRILALLVFEPEDRQLLESPAVLKSLELLQLRRNRAARAGRDSTVDMNQAILLGDEELIKRLLKLVAVMNFAPPLRRFSPYHVMARFPFIGDILVMLGLGELDSWEEIERQERLALMLLEPTDDSQVNVDEPELLLSELGTVADMLEGLSSTLTSFSRQTQNQIGRIIHVISAAQQAGVIVGRNRNRRGRRQRLNRSSENSNNTRTVSSGNDSRDGGSGFTFVDISVDGSSNQGLASAAGILNDQLLFRRLYQNSVQDDSALPEEQPGVTSRHVAVESNDRAASTSHGINSPEDAANSLQFNAMLLGPYQVEVLFVLCTLLGGRRKLDAQDMLTQQKVVSVLDGMFQRLPWYKHNSNQDSPEDDDQHNSNDTIREPVQQSNGIHGPGCECTPESALCVQYLRMLHNFCDRDCDNYEGRRLLLSETERHLVFGGSLGLGRKLKHGLLSKIIDSFIRESDESPYRFWLASCIESYLRGSSPAEQVFAAQSGLLDHLVQEISSDRLHCAGSLQTSFDLLGELAKGNAEVVRLLLDELDEERFRKLMSVAAANLVDSNVFIRSLLLSLERLSSSEGLFPLYIDTAKLHIPRHTWSSPDGSNARSYLTHSWWDTPTRSLLHGESSMEYLCESNTDEDRPSDWFPPRELIILHNPRIPGLAALPTGLNESIGHFGWVFTPIGEALTANAFLPNTVERLGWFLAANQARLLRDLLRVVDLRNINHENICCLNTAVVIAIFAHRRKQLSALLNELRLMNDEEQESKRRASSAANRRDDVVDRAFVQAMRYLDLDLQREHPPYARRASLSNAAAAIVGRNQQIGDRADVMRNFREVLWFWMEYYSHRGRDRLSLEFSSHIRFHEWHHVVSLLSADDGSPTALVRSPVLLPVSPYQRAARAAETPVRGE